MPDPRPYVDNVPPVQRHDRLRLPPILLVPVPQPPSRAAPPRERSGQRHRQNVLRTACDLGDELVAERGEERWTGEVEALVFGYADSLASADAEAAVGDVTPSEDLSLVGES